LGQRLKEIAGGVFRAEIEGLKEADEGEILERFKEFQATKGEAAIELSEEKR
jgi:hypothetical protein